MPGFNIPLDNYNASSCSDKTQTSGTITTIGGTGTTVFKYPDNKIETSRAHRFEVVFYSVPTLSGVFEDITVYAKTCQRPSFEVDLITIHHQAEEIYRPGKYRWNTVDVTFYEYLKGTGKDVQNKTSQMLYSWYTNTVTSQHKQETVSKINTASARIYELDGNGNTARTYVLYNCKIVKLVPSDFDHTSSELSTNTATLRYDYAVEED